MVFYNPIKVVRVFPQSVCVKSEVVTYIRPLLSISFQIHQSSLHLALYYVIESVVK